MNQALMAWHINKTQHIAIGQWSVGVTQLNGNAACFFFFQSVGVHPGQGAYQCGLAVIDVASRADNHATYSCSCWVKAGSSLSSIQRWSSQRTSSRSEEGMGVKECGRTF